jgi:hypothetical protein
MSGTAQKSVETLTERYEALLRVSQTLISIRSSEELFNLLARDLRAVVKFPSRLQNSRRKKPSAGGCTSISSP